MNALAVFSFLCWIGHGFLSMHGCFPIIPMLVSDAISIGVQTIGGQGNTSKIVLGAFWHLVQFQIYGWVMRVMTLYSLKQVKFRYLLQSKIIQLAEDVCASPDMCIDGEFWNP